MNAFVWMLQNPTKNDFNKKKKKGTDFSYVIQEVDVATGALIEWLKNVRYGHLSHSSAFFFSCLLSYGWNITFTILDITYAGYDRIFLDRKKGESYVCSFDKENNIFSRSTSQDFPWYLHC